MRKRRRLTFRHPSIRLRTMRWRDDLWQQPRGRPRRPRQSPRRLAGPWFSDFSDCSWIWFAGSARFCHFCFSCGYMGHVARIYFSLLRFHTERKLKRKTWDSRQFLYPHHNLFVFILLIRFSTGFFVSDYSKPLPLTRSWIKHIEQSSIMVFIACLIHRFST